MRIWVTLQSKNNATGRCYSGGPGPGAIFSLAPPPDPEESPALGGARGKRRRRSGGGGRTRLRPAAPPITARSRRDLEGSGGPAPPRSPRSLPPSPPPVPAEPLTVPGRAHELVQHGAHLGLRRHLERAGAARPGRVTPTPCGLQGPRLSALPLASLADSRSDTAAGDEAGAACGRAADGGRSAKPAPRRTRRCRLPSPRLAARFLSRLPRARASANGNPRARVVHPPLHPLRDVIADGAFGTL